MIRAQLAMEMPDEGNRERSRFRLVEMLCGKADRKEIREDSITGILTNSYGINQRYARMYKQIYREGSAKLHEAVLSDVSPAEQKKILAEKKSKSVTVHIPISAAVKICALSKKDQDKVIARVNKGEKVLEVLKNFKE